MGKKIYVESDGCNRRLLEVAKIWRYLESNGYEQVDNPVKADYVLLSTCAFKKDEEEYSIERIKSLKKYNAKLLVYGCLPDISPQKFNMFKNIKHIAPKDLDNIDSFFNSIETKYSEIEETNFIENFGKSKIIKTIKTKLNFKNILNRESYIRALAHASKKVNSYINKSYRDYFLYVCRGCTGKCSYCAIKRAVGSVKSREINAVLKEFRSGYEKNNRNFIILGDDPGCYGLDINTTLPSLLSALIEESETLSKKKNGTNDNKNNARFHINEIHPKFLILYEKQLLKILASNQFKSILCPIQSGNDRILKLMQREHISKEICHSLKAIKDKNSNIQICTQIIVGFPSETKREFLDTLEFLIDLPFKAVTIFQYHDKENTVASKLEPKVPETEIEKRIKLAVKYLRQNKITTYTKCPI